MEYINTYWESFNNNELASKMVRYLFWLFLIILFVQIIKRFLTRKIPTSSTRYKSQKGIQAIGYVLMVFLTVSFFTGSIKDFTLAIGLLSAGIAFALQELVLSVAGSIYIFTNKVYKPGDRIEINGIKGDVIDIDTVYTTMMEIGEWVDSENYSGRIVKVSNAFVFKSAVYNYSQDFPFVWDEINIPIHYESNIDDALMITKSVALEVLNEFTESSKLTWKNIVKKYYIEDAQLDPSVTVKITDNWAQINLRYIVDYKERRITKHKLHSLILEQFKKTNGSVRIGSSSLDILSVPVVKVKVQ
ncbi:MAG: small-conductance mechanosensitive channel [Crocinitomicaceae bacterium]|jgi:small-conductance mechanosensitive channel